MGSYYHTVNLKQQEYITECLNYFRIYPVILLRNKDTAVIFFFHKKQHRQKNNI